MKRFLSVSSDVFIARIMGHKSVWRGGGGGGGGALVVLDENLCYVCRRCSV